MSVDIDGFCMRISGIILFSEKAFRKLPKPRIIFFHQTKLRTDGQGHDEDGDGPLTALRLVQVNEDGGIAHQGDDHEKGQDDNLLHHLGGQFPTDDSPQGRRIDVGNSRCWCSWRNICRQEDKHPFRRHLCGNSCGHPLRRPRCRWGHHCRPFFTVNSGETWKKESKGNHSNNWRTY